MFNKPLALNFCEKIYILFPFSYLILTDVHLFEKFSFVITFRQFATLNTYVIKNKKYVISIIISYFINKK